MGIIEEYWSAAVRRLQIETDGFNRLVQHNGEVGRANELAVVDFFERLLPPNIGVGTGEIFDASGSRSKQTDIIFYEKHRFPTLLSQGVTLLYPIDTVVLAVEVKTTLNRNEVADIGGKVEALRRLTPSLASRALPDFSVFGFHATDSPATSIDQFRALGETKWPDSLLVVDPGYVGEANETRDFFAGHLVPLHKLDPDGNKVMGDWEPVPNGDSSGAFQRDGASYPTSRLTPGYSGPRVAFEPGRALLLYSGIIMKSLAKRGLLEESWFESYLDPATTDTVGC